MPVAGSDACSQCGSALNRDAIYCPNCGEAQAAAPGASSTGTLVLMVLVGIVVALPAWWVLTFAGVGLLGNLGVPAGYTPEFYVPWPARLYFILLTLLAFVGLIVAARAQHSLPLRVFVITLLSVMLGLFSICDIFALSSSQR